MFGKYCIHTSHWLVTFSTLKKTNYDTYCTVYDNYTFFSFTQVDLQQQPAQVICSMTMVFPPATPFSALHTILLRLKQPSMNPTPDVFEQLEKSAMWVMRCGLEPGYSSLPHRVNECITTKTLLCLNLLCIELRPRYKGP